MKSSFFIKKSSNTIIPEKMDKKFLTYKTYPNFYPDENSSVIVKLTENCGLFGVYNNPKAVELTFLGIYSLQHRGQESCGVVYYDSNKFHQLKSMGLVNEFLKRIDLKNIKANSAIGHIRYSTTGDSSPVNIQPILINSYKGSIAVAHNGNLTNAKELRDYLHKKGAIFQTTVDSEVILHLISHSKFNSIDESIRDALKKIKGGFALLFLTKDAIYCARDSMGNRPLCIGKKNSTYFVSSEDCALNIVGAKFIREVNPGEVVKITNKGLESFYFENKIKNAHCVFELIYFARPDSKIFNINVNQFREECGKMLAYESPVQADFVIAVPDSGNYAALGYSKQSGIPFEIGLVRNHYIGRTFIQHTQTLRENDVKLKLMPIKNILENKKIIIIDDSIVRGTTIKKIIKILRSVNVKEIHLRIASPPYLFPCYFGIDTPNKEEFIAHKMSIAEIKNYLNVDSLHYLSIEGLKKVLKNDYKNFCFACFNGNYPQKIKEGLHKKILEE
jgi:amidophosphoribosyltransferase